MRVLHAPLFTAIVAQSIRETPSAEFHHLSKFVWAFSFLHRPFDGRTYFGLLLRMVLGRIDQINSPGAHSILWGVWQSGFQESVQDIFDTWTDFNLDPDDLIGTAELLLMDIGWERLRGSRSGGDERLLEMVEGSQPNVFIQGTLSKCIRGYVVEETLAVHAWDENKVERNKPELAKYMMHFKSLERWTQPGTGNHWRKLGSLVEHIDALADRVDSRSMPLSMIKLIERFAEGARNWLKVAGGAKAALLEESVRTRDAWHPWEVLLECGTFIGYSALRFAIVLKEFDVERVVTVEVDPIQACIARHFIDLAGCSKVIEIWIGQFRDVLCRPIEEFGHRSIGLVFLDYKGTVFHIDLQTLHRHETLAPSARSLADNVVLPGAPLYLWEMTRNKAWSTSVWALEEFLEPNVEDWMCLSTSMSPAWHVESTAPSSWFRLSWHTDHMRRRAQGLRPSESGMAELDRVLYAQHVKSHYLLAGIQAMPWTRSPPQRLRFEQLRSDNDPVTTWETQRAHWPAWGQ